MEFQDISTEEYREYLFGDKVVRIPGSELHVSKSGGHRIKGVDGLSYYVPMGWNVLRWKVKAGAPMFSF